MALPRLGFGTYRLRGSAVCAPLRHALTRPSRPYKVVDTAEGYRNGKEVAETIEDVISQGFIERSDLIIQSKLGPPSQGDASTEAIQGISNDFERLLPLDLLLIHWPGTAKLSPEDPANRTNRIKTWQVMESFVKEGKIKSIGVSNYTMAHMKELWEHATIPPANLQIEIHPLNWKDQVDLVQWCHERGVSVTAYSSLGEGQLLNSEVCPELDNIHNGKSKSQILLRWALQRGLHVIPKASSPERIDENAGCLDFTLDDTALKLLDDIGNDTTRRRKFCWDPSVVV